MTAPRYEVYELPRGRRGSQALNALKRAAYALAAAVMMYLLFGRRAG